MLVVMDCWGNIYKLKMTVADKLPKFDKSVEPIKVDLTKTPEQNMKENPELTAFLADLLGVK